MTSAVRRPHAGTEFWRTRGCTFLTFPRETTPWTPTDTQRVRAWTFGGPMTEDVIEAPPNGTWPWYRFLCTHLHISRNRFRQNTSIFPGYFREICSSRLKKSGIECVILAGSSRFALPGLNSDIHLSWSSSGGMQCAKNPTFSTFFTPKTHFFLVHRCTRAHS